MRKLLVFSDLHVTSGGQTIIGLNPAKRLAEALDHAIERHGDAEAVVLLGDLTHHGREQEYRALSAILNRVPLPVRVTVGNHDNRAACRAVLGSLPDVDGFALQAFDLGRIRCLLIDTVDEDGAVPRHAGHLCARRLDWIEQELSAHRGRPIVAFCHHPPFATGFDGMDAIRLLNGQELIRHLSAHDAPVHLICGHIHRTISGNAGGIGYTVLKSPCHQMPMRLGDPSSGSSVDEPGAYGIVLEGPDGVIVHTEDHAIASGAVHSDAASH